MKIPSPNKNLDSFSSSECVCSRLSGCLLFHLQAKLPHSFTWNSFQSLLNVTLFLKLSISFSPKWEIHTLPHLCGLEEGHMFS